MAVLRMPISSAQNLVSEPAPRPNCKAWRLGAVDGSMSISQAIMRWMYSCTSAVGSSISMEP